MFGEVIPSCTSKIGDLKTMDGTGFCAGTVFAWYSKDVFMKDRSLKLLMDLILLMHLTFPYRDNSFVQNSVYFPLLYGSGCDCVRSSNTL